MAENGNEIHSHSFPTPQPSSLKTMGKLKKEATHVLALCTVYKAVWLAV
jgi:hypothetical protein